jgi:hypothetical protein
MVGIVGGKPETNLEDGRSVSAKEDFIRLVNNYFFYEDPTLPLTVMTLFAFSSSDQCCGSRSGNQCFFDLWVRDPG